MARIENDTSTYNRCIDTNTCEYCDHVECLSEMEDGIQQKLESRTDVLVLCYKDFSVKCMVALTQVEQEYLIYKVMEALGLSDEKLRCDMDFIRDTVYSLYLQLFTNLNDMANDFLEREGLPAAGVAKLPSLQKLLLINKELNIVHWLCQNDRTFCGIMDYILTDFLINVVDANAADSCNGRKG